MTTPCSRRRKLYRAAIRAIEAILLCSMLLCVVSAIVIKYRHFYKSTGPYRREYVGRIVEKTIWPNNTLEGSFVDRCLIIEEKGGSRSFVYVREDTFARAQPGQWIRRTQKGIQLFSTDPTETSR